MIRSAKALPSWLVQDTSVRNRPSSRARLFVEQFCLRFKRSHYLIELSY